jgi:hypothetical protein
MKPYSIFSVSGYFAALLVLTVGWTMGQGGIAYAQDGAAVGKETPALKNTVVDGRPCGGPNRLTCGAGLICVDNPNDNCNPTKDGIECPGTCMANTTKEGKIDHPCGGPTRITCRGGMICVDDPSDNCDPTKDGVDCIGRCIPRP